MNSINYRFRINFSFPGNEIFQPAHAFRLILGIIRNHHVAKLLKESFTHIFSIALAGMNYNRLNLWSFFQALKILVILIKLGLAPTT